MKFNYKFLVSVIIISSVIITIRFKLFSSYNSDYDFVRDIDVNNSLIPDTISFLNEIHEYSFITLTDNMLVLYKKKDSYENTYLLIYFDFIQKKKIEEMLVKIPPGLISFSKGHDVFWINQFNLYSTNIHIKDTKKIFPNSEDFIFNAFPLKGKDTYLCFGEKKMDKGYMFGFYRVNIDDSTCFVAKELNLQINSDDKIEKSLIYNGEFVVNGNYISYVCKRIPFIYVFNLNGDFIQKITTKDNVPEPELVEFNNIYSYKRGSTFNSNIGVYIANDEVCVLSYRISDIDSIIIDKYLLKTGEYLGSFLIENTNRTNREINHVFQFHNNLILATINKFYSYRIK
jgi:hypothetical protein